MKNQNIDKDTVLEHFFELAQTNDEEAVQYLISNLNSFAEEQRLAIYGAVFHYQSEKALAALKNENQAKQIISEYAKLLDTTSEIVKTKQQIAEQ